MSTTLGFTNTKNPHKKVQLLSPAGNLHKLKIALQFGADAVYGGVSHFSLRNRASKNFSYEDFKTGIDYAHQLGKKVYVTINGFPFNSQLDSLKNHLAKMRDLRPDAFIIATPGIVKLASTIAPNIPIHLSTQANVLNVLDAQVYFDMGVRRIVAAREVSLQDCIDIKKVLPNLEIEIFVHGSMCFAFSGYTFCYLWFHFLDSVAFLPLIFLGIERVIQKKDPRILLVGFLLNAMVSYFFFVVFMIGGFLYAIFRFFQTIKSQRKTSLIEGILIVTHFIIHNIPYT